MADFNDLKSIMNEENDLPAEAKAEEKNKNKFKKINIKRGLRRIVLSFIGFCILITFIFFCLSGGIWEQSKYELNTKVFKLETPEKHININEFIRDYIDESNYYGVRCYPYKGYCEFKNIKFSNNKSITLTKENLQIYTDAELLRFKKTKEKPEITLMFQSPSKLQYFLWQLRDFLLIFVIAGTVYMIYMLFEFVFCWIIKGFKEEQ